MEEDANDVCVACKKTVEFLRKKKIRRIKISSKEHAKLISDSLGEDVLENSIICEKCKSSHKFIKLKQKPVQSSKSISTQLIESTSKSGDHGSISKPAESGSNELPSCSYKYSPAEIPPKPMIVQEDLLHLYTGSGPTLRERKAPDHQLENEGIHSDNCQLFSSESSTSEASLFPSPMKKTSTIKNSETVQLPFSRTIIVHTYCFICGCKMEGKKKLSWLLFHLRLVYKYSLIDIFMFQGIIVAAARIYLKNVSTLTSCNLSDRMLPVVKFLSWKLQNSWMFCQ